jgi:hypothetical protein
VAVLQGAAAKKRSFGERKRAEGAKRSHGKNKKMFVLFS